MDPEEKTKLLQDIRMHAKRVLTNEDDARDFQKLVASSTLLQVEKDDENRERMEVFMPQMLKALEGGASHAMKDLRAHNVQLQDALAHAQNDLRLLAKDTVKYSVDAIGKPSAGLDHARFELLASQEVSCALMEKIDEVDWYAVYDLRIRAPRFIDYPADAPMGLYKDCWLYIDNRGTLTSDQCVVFDNLDDEVAAVYRITDEEAGEAQLYWERRFVYTAQMSKGRLDDLKREMKRRAK